MKYVGEVLILVVYSGILYLLVRPKSRGPQLIGATTNGLANLVHAGEGK